MYIDELIIEFKKLINHKQFSNG